MPATEKFTVESFLRKGETHFQNRTWKWVSPVYFNKLVKGFTYKNTFFRREKTIENVNCFS